MSHDPPVARCQVKITVYEGLHMRPAEKFVKLANRFQSEIRVLHNGAEVNGKSILDLTLLAAECGTLLDLEARGPDAEEAIALLARLVCLEFRDDEGAQAKDSTP